MILKVSLGNPMALAVSTLHNIPKGDPYYTAVKPLKLGHKFFSGLKQIRIIGLNGAYGNDG
jgi:hypothetical protein